MILHPCLFEWQPVIQIAWIHFFNSSSLRYPRSFQSSVSFATTHPEPRLIWVGPLKSWCKLSQNGKTTTDGERGSRAPAWLHLPGSSFSGRFQVCIPNINIQFRLIWAPLVCKLAKQISKNWKLTPKECRLDIVSKWELAFCKHHTSICPGTFPRQFRKDLGPQLVTRFVLRRNNTWLEFSQVTACTKNFDLMRHLQLGSLHRWGCHSVQCHQC